MAKDVIARIILMFLLGLAIGGFIVLFLADRAKAEMTDQWGHQRYEAPRHRHVTKKRVRHTHKKHRRKRAPAVKAYVKRDVMSSLRQALRALPGASSNERLTSETENVLRGVDVPIMNRATMHTLPLSYIKTCAPFRATDCTAIGTSLSA